MWSTKRYEKCNMKSLLASFLILSLTTLVLPLTASAAVCAIETTTGVYGHIRFTSDGFADSTPFTPTSNCTVTAIGVSLGYFTSITAPAVRVSIFSDSGGKPGSVIGYGSSIQPLAPASYNNPCLIATSTVSQTISLTSGTQYWIVASSTANGTNDNYTCSDNGVGTSYYSTAWPVSSWTSNPGYFPYEVDGTPPVASSPAPSTQICLAGFCFMI